MSWVIESPARGFLDPNGHYTGIPMQAQQYRSVNTAQRNLRPGHTIVFYDTVLERIRGQLD
jgi:hypothetical protein